ncbi:MAG: TasA family protein [Patescibacteria group bacterium]
MQKVLSIQRILLALGILVFLGAAIVGATGAFFSDTETSTGNTFAAGELDLTIDNSSYGFDYNDPNNREPIGNWGLNASNSWTLRNLNECGPLDQNGATTTGPCLFFNFDDLKPGDYGEDTISLHVQNDAYACMALKLTATPENDVNEAEAEGLPVDTTLGSDEGELQNYLNFAFWRDDGDNVFECTSVGEDQTTCLATEQILFQDSATNLSQVPNTIADPGNGQVLKADDTYYVGKSWCFGKMSQNPVQNNGNAAPTETTTGFTCDGVGNHNDAQTDGIVVNVEFSAVQARNNAGFLCSPLLQ